jgi:hypothetical protein
MDKDALSSDGRKQGARALINAVGGWAVYCLLVQIIGRRKSRKRSPIYYANGFKCSRMNSARREDNC